MPKTSTVIAVLFALLALPAMPAAAGQMYRASFTNNTMDEVIQIRMDLKTEHDLRRDRTRVLLAPGQSYQIGISGAIEPQRIVVELPTARFEFADLSGLDMRPEMWFTISTEDDGIWLKQDEPDGTSRRVAGKVSRYLTPDNVLNAVSKDSILTAVTRDDARALVAASVEANQPPAEKREPFNVEAGPIWNNDHAQVRCPELLAEWNEQHRGEDIQARWTGAWATTVEGEMSVCSFVRGGAPLDATLFEDAEDRLLIFPINWNDRIGVGRAIPIGRETEEIAVSLMIPIQDETFGEVMKELLDQGFRPWMSRLDRRSGDDVDVRYAETSDSAEADGEKTTDAFNAARSEGDLFEFGAILVQPSTYSEAASDKELTPAPGVMLRCSPHSLEAVFLKNCTPMIY